MNLSTRVIFAHGLESSPNGTKATYLREHLGAVTPSLFRLDLFDQAGALEKEMQKDQPNVLVGSSLGGLAAMKAAARCPSQIAHLILLAPAVSSWRHKETFQEAEKTRPGLYLQSFELSELSIPEDVPATIIHGIEDEVVLTEDVVSLCIRSPSSRLVLLHDDHSLSGSRDTILSAVSRAASGDDPIVLG